MADVESVVNQVLAALRTVQDISGVHDGYVPEKLPETDGYVDPYVVFWAGTGEVPGETSSDGQQTADSIVWDFQTTAVGASASICRSVDKAVQAVLLNRRIGTGRVRFNPMGFNQQSPILDTQTTPSRLYLPRQWRLITN